MLQNLVNKFRAYQRAKELNSLLEGKIPAQSDKPSILHLSLNKAATQFIKKILKENAHSNGLRFVDYHGYFFDISHPYFDNMDKEHFNKFQKAFCSRGFVYSSFGGPLRHLDDLNVYKKLIIIRDPRDILTSNYYSTSFSHALPKNKNALQSFLRERHKVASQDIDKFVLEKKEILKTKYLEYIDFLAFLDTNKTLIKYEEMIENPKSFLDSLEIDLNFKIMHKDKYLELMKVPKEADVTSHKRKMLPGDYLDKLKKDTIEILNIEFSHILNYFGYKC